jgi:undecaprenyl-diphosphatase
VSGHAAVAAATGVVVVAVLPRRWRPLAVGVALVVGVARIVHGVHLPADVVGGWSLGALVGLAAVELADRVKASSGSLGGTDG